MSGDSLQVKIDFGKYHLVIDGFHTPVEAADFAADLMQKLSEGKSLEEIQKAIDDKGLLTHLERTIPADSQLCIIKASAQ